MTSHQIHAPLCGHDVHGLSAVAVGAVEVAFAPVAGLLLLVLSLVRSLRLRRA